MAQLLIATLLLAVCREAVGAARKKGLSSGNVLDTTETGREVFPLGRFSLGAEYID